MSTKKPKWIRAEGVELAREVDVGSVLENHGHLREAVAGEGARVVEIWQAGHRSLHGVGDALLGLQWRETRRLRVDLDLDVGDIRHRVDRQALVVVDSQGAHPERDDQDKPSMADGRMDQGGEHGRWA